MPDKGSIIIAKSDYITEAGVTTTGSGWTAPRPATNVVSTKFADVARSTGTSAALSVDLGSEREVSLISIPSHSLTSLATWRIRFSNNPLLLTDPDSVPLFDISYDSNTLLSSRTSTTSFDLSTVIPTNVITVIVSANSYYHPGDVVVLKGPSFINYIVGGVVSWDTITRELVLTVTGTAGTDVVANWVVDRLASQPFIWPGDEAFGSTPYAEFIWGGITLNEPSVGTPAVSILPLNTTTRYISIELEDSNNPDGFFDVSKLVVSPGWRPTIGIGYGWSVRYIDPSSTSRSRSGAVYSDKLPKYREVKFRLNNLTRDEMFGTMFELDRSGGVVEPVLVVIDPDDVDNLRTLTIYGTQKSLAPITNSMHKTYVRDVLIEEWL